MEDEFLEPENFQSTNEKLTFQTIILQQVQKISRLSSTELTGGYYEEKIVNGTIIKNRVPDTRESYINAVQNLRDMLTPYYDEDMIKILEILDNIWKELSEEYQEKLKSEKSESIKNNIYQEYLDENLTLKRKLFSELIKLLFRNKFLAAGVTQEND